MEAEGFKLEVHEEDNERRERSAEPAEQGAEAAEMAEPTAATTCSSNDEKPAHSSSGKLGGIDNLLLSDDSHKSNKSSGSHRTRGEPSSSSAGSRYSADKFMTLDDLDKGHSPKPPALRGGGGELADEEPADLSYEQWASGDQVT